MTQTPSSLGGRQARNGGHDSESSHAPEDSLKEMAIQIRELDAAAERAAVRIDQIASGISRDDPAGGSATTRTDLLAGLASALVDRTGQIRADCDRLTSLMDRTRRLIAEHDLETEPAQTDSAPEPGQAARSEPTAVEPSTDSRTTRPRWLSRGDGATASETSEGVRLIATQMAIAGSSRVEIERRLRIQFGVDHANRVLDDIFGDHRTEVG